MRELRRKKALLCVICGGALAGFGMTSISQFLAVFLARVHHMGVREAATLYGTISGTFLAIGLIAGSFGTDLLARRGDPRWPAWGAAAGLFAAPFLYWLAFAAHGLAAASLLLVLAGSLLLLFFGPTAGMIQNMLEPRMRATGAALYAMLYTLIGSGLGPTFVGYVSDRFAARAFGGAGYTTVCLAGRSGPRLQAHVASACADAAARGVQLALSLAVCVFFVAATFYLLASRTLVRDLYEPGEGRQ